MSHIIADRVKEKIQSPASTGILSLLNTTSGYRRFSSVMSSGDTCYYCLECPSNGDWECGLGTYSSNNALSRTTVYSSSNSGAIVNFANRVSYVFISYVASRAIYLDPSGELNLALSTLNDVSLTAPASGESLKYNGSSWVNGAASGYTTEEAQDAVGGILTDTSSISFSYNDGAPSIAASVRSSGITDVMISGGVDALKIGSGTVSSAEFGYLDGVTSSLQVQLDSKYGSANPSGYLTASVASATYQPLDSDLTSIASTGVDPYGIGLLTKTSGSGVRDYIGAGTSSFDGAYGSLSGVPSTFAPSAHTHGNITNAGAIGSTTGLPIVTTASGVLTAGSFGTTAGTFAAGDDSRITGALSTSTAAATYAVIAAGQPTSGTVGQVLAKNSGTNYDSSWTSLVLGDRYLSTSTTSNAVSNGTKTFTIGTGLAYTPTQNITIAYDATHHMHGEVTTYNSGTGVLVVDINNHTGTGTYTSWVVNVGGVTPATVVSWGDIIGTLGTQSDLSTALNAKLEITTAASTYVPLTRTLNTLALSADQTFAVGTGGTNFAIASSGTAHTFNIPDASATARGLITTGTQTIAGAKTFSTKISVPGNISDSSAQFGSFELQSYAVNNCWLGDNIYFNGGFKHRSAGMGAVQYFNAGGFHVFTCPSNTAGAVATTNYRFSIANNGDFDLGGTRGNSNLTTSGATIYGVGGLIGIGKSNPSVALDVVGAITASGTILTQNGTSPTSIQITNTYTSATSYELLNIKAVAAANFEIGPENGSAGGTLRGLTIGGYAAGTTTIAPWLSFTNTGNAVLTNTVSTSGSPTALTLTGAAHTTLALSTEATDVNFNLARTVQFATGALTTQRAMRIQAPTYSFVGASTITTASTLSISGAPVAGTNATITNAYALNVESGTSNFNGGTVTTAIPMITASQTWNDAAVSFASIRLSITPTASLASRAILIDGTGTNGLAPTSSDFITCTKNGGTTAVIQLTGKGAVYVTDPGYSVYSFQTNSGNAFRADGAGFGITSSGINLGSVQVLRWSSTTNWYDTPDLIATRDAAGTLAIRNGTNAQTFRVYNTYTSGTSLELLQARGVASANFEFGPMKGSAGGALCGLTIGGYATESAAITPWLSFTNAGAATFSGPIASAKGIYFTSEPTGTPSGTTQTLTLADGNHQTLALTSATGTVTATLTVPTGSSSGTIIVKQHASAAKDITWAVSAGTIKWMGTEPDWAADAISSVRIVSWRYDGSVMYLGSTEVAV